MMEQYRADSYLFGGNAPYVEELYEAYLDNPGSVPDNWRTYFDNLQHVPAVDGTEARDVAHLPVIQSFAQRAKANAFVNRASGDDLAIARKQLVVQSLISAHRSLGARWADLDPLKRLERPKIPELEPAFYDLNESDMDTTFSATNTYFSTAEHMTLREILKSLRETYCGTIGAEIMHITQPVEKRWWQERLESVRGKATYTADEKKHILERLTAAEGLERYLHTKYVGQKRFSLEGGESFIPAMDELIQRGGSQGVQEIVIGMAHRGRLNVLVNTLGKMPKDLFAEFDHTAKEDLPSGDVKYHQGFSSDVTTRGGPVHLSLAFNPSHLEIVNPVVEGSVKARMERRGDLTGSQVLPVLVHGDAAFAGQGVVMETLALAQTRGYYTGGTLHLVINNQIGFTTSDPRDSRSSLYCTDVVKMIDAPVLHVNGDDPEAVVLCTQLAMDYRHQFRKDVVVDIVCFRKLGHNEQDTPSLTQPLMYKKIAAHPGTRRLYGDKLVAQGVLEADGPDQMVKSFRAAMDEGRHTVDPVLTNFKSKYAVDWAPFLGKKWTDAADTALPLAEVRRLSERVTTVPEGFKVHPLVEKVLTDRAAMGRGEINVDWGMGETLAYASLVASGYAVRLSGEDCGRGTFTHRHAVLHDQNRERWDTGTYVPLENIAEGQARFNVIDSLLSEEAVLGFEYGYASAEPNTLVIWEAQFGDFANSGQVIIDSFIASGESKWGLTSRMTLLLPHGHEGAGPEHSSARMERFLSLAAEGNMRIANPSTAAQYFHLLRRQALIKKPRPLIIFTPKGMLRQSAASAHLSQLTDEHFHFILDDPRAQGRRDKVERMVLCSGRIYFDIDGAEAREGSEKVAVVRVELLYPFARIQIEALIKSYPNLREIVWAQEEPRNMGAWSVMSRRLPEIMGDIKLDYIGRPERASPGEGYSVAHVREQERIVLTALTV